MTEAIQSSTNQAAAETIKKQNTAQQQTAAQQPAGAQQQAGVQQPAGAQQTAAAASPAQQAASNPADSSIFTKVDATKTQDGNYRYKTDDFDITTSNEGSVYIDSNGQYHAKDLKNANIVGTDKNNTINLYGCQVDNVDMKNGDDTINSVDSTFKNQVKFGDSKGDTFTLNNKKEAFGTSDYCDNMLNSSVKKMSDDKTKEMNGTQDKIAQQEALEAKNKEEKKEEKTGSPKDSKVKVQPWGTGEDDCLSRIVNKQYGDFVTDKNRPEIYQAMQDLNPQIKDVNTIYAGNELKMPEFDVDDKGNIKGYKEAQDKKTEETDKADDTAKTEEEPAAQEDKTEKSTQETIDDLKSQYDEIKKGQGFIGKAADGFKNFFNTKNCSENIEKTLNGLNENSTPEEIQAAKDMISKYDSNQESAVGAAASTGAAAAGGLVGAKAGAAIGTAVCPGVGTVAGIAIGAAVGAAASIGVHQAENMTDDVKGNSWQNDKNLAKEATSGAIAGGTAVLGGQIANKLTGSLASKAGLTTVEKGSRKAFVALAEDGTAKVGTTVLKNAGINAASSAVTSAAIADGTYLAECATDKNKDFSVNDLGTTTATSLLLGGTIGAVAGGVKGYKSANKYNNALIAKTQAEVALAKNNNVRPDTEATAANASEAQGTPAENNSGRFDTEATAANASEASNANNPLNKYTKDNKSLSNLMKRDELKDVRFMPLGGRDANSTKCAWKMHVFANSEDDLAALQDTVGKYLNDNGINSKVTPSYESLSDLPAKQAGKAFTIYPESPEAFKQIASDLDYIINSNNLNTSGTNIVGDRALGNSGRLFYRYEYKSGAQKDLILDLADMAQDNYYRNICYDANRGANSYLASDMTAADDPFYYFNPSER